MTHIKQRGGLASAWTSANPVLMENEVGWESNTRKAKLGDGVTPWNDLPYVVTIPSKADMGLGNVDNTSDANKPVSTAMLTALNLKAGLVSPVFTGDPRVPTPSASDNDTTIASTAFVKTVVNNLIGGSPALLDTLDELAAALGDDPNFAATMATALGLKAPLASPTFTGDPKAPTPAASDNDTTIATTAFVRTPPAGGIDLNSEPYVGTGWQRYKSGATDFAGSAAPRGGLVRDNTNTCLTIPITGWWSVAAFGGFGIGSSGTVARRGIAIGTGINNTTPGGKVVQDVVTVASVASSIMMVSGHIYLTAGDQLSVWRYTDGANHYSAGNGYLTAILQG